MRTLILAAGKQTRWNESGGDGLKQHITADGEPIIRRAFRLASERCDDVLTIVENTRLGAWRGLNPRKAHPDPRMGEMNKFLDARPHWPDEGHIVLLYGDVYYTPAVLDIIYGHEPTQPTVYGRALAKGRRLESFSFRFRVPDDVELIERVARECADHGLNVKGGPWRWFHQRHVADGSYSARRVKKLAQPENGWIEIPPDETDDFDKVRDLERWRRQTGIAP